MTEDWCKIDWINQRLCLYGQESLSSFHHQSLIARRVTDFQTIVTTQLDFSPETFQQMAGLAFYYNTAHYHYCHVTVNDTGDPMLRIITSDNHQISEWETPLQVDGPIHLRGIMDSGTLQFSYSNDGESWIQAGEILDATILSDDYVTHGSDRYRPAFTGMFVGLCCQDLTGQLLPAHFHYFEYKPL
jgi:xylan 1,4-beta-xylosidase